MYQVKVQRFGYHTLPLPKQETLGGAGFDLRSTLSKVILEPGERALIPVGFGFELPEGWAGLVWDRSGHATKRGLTTLAGLIDNDYRGQVHAVLYNAGQETATLEYGDRICQLIVIPYLQGETVEVDQLSDTVRGEGGFGSTGEK